MPVSLTDSLVRAAKARVKEAMGLLSVRQSLLMDPAGVTDRDIAEWLTRGETLRVQGVSASSDGLSQHDRRCIELCELDAAKHLKLRMYAGEAAARILTSHDPRAYSAQAKLISHLLAHDAEQAKPVERGVGVAQEDMDAMSETQLRQLEALMEERQRVSRLIDAHVAAAKQSRPGQPDRDDMH